MTEANDQGVSTNDQDVAGVTSITPTANGIADHEAAMQDTLARVANTSVPGQAKSAATIQDVLAKHQAEHGCVLPMNRVATPQATVQVHALMAAAQSAPQVEATGGTTGATLPGTLPGFYPFPLTTPSQQQNRTTQTPGRHMRHPTNQIKPLLITTQLAEDSTT
jgi:hypothetical protein